jgi:hypothetical protein
MFGRNKHTVEWKYAYTRRELTRRPKKKPIENREQVRRSTRRPNKKQQKTIENREQVRRSNFKIYALAPYFLSVFFLVAALTHGD